MSHPSQKFQRCCSIQRKMGARVHMYSSGCEMESPPRALQHGGAMEFHWAVAALLALRRQRMAVASSQVLRERKHRLYMNSAFPAPLRRGCQLLLGQVGSGPDRFRRQDPSRKCIGASAIGFLAEIRAGIAKFRQHPSLAQESLLAAEAGARRGARCRAAVAGRGRIWQSGGGAPADLVAAWPPASEFEGAGQQRPLSRIRLHRGRRRVRIGGKPARRRLGAPPPLM